MHHNSSVGWTFWGCSPSLDGSDDGDIVRVSLTTVPVWEAERESVSLAAGTKVSLEALACALSLAASGVFRGSKTTWSSPFANGILSSCVVPGASNFVTFKSAVPSRTESKNLVSGSNLFGPTNRFRQQEGNKRSEEPCLRKVRNHSIQKDKQGPLIVSLLQVHNPVWRSFCLSGHDDMQTTFYLHICLPELSIEAGFSSPLSVEGFEVCRYSITLGNKFQDENKRG